MQIGQASGRRAGFDGHHVHPILLQQRGELIAASSDGQKPSVPQGQHPAAAGSCDANIVVRSDFKPLILESIIPKV